MTRIITNKAKCKCCGEVVESHSSPSNYETCSCGNLCVGGGQKNILRAASRWDMYEELSEIRSIDDEDVRLEQLPAPGPRPDRHVYRFDGVDPRGERTPRHFTAIILATRKDGSPVSKVYSTDPHRAVNGPLRFEGGTAVMEFDEEININFMEIQKHQSAHHSVEAISWEVQTPVPWEKRELGDMIQLEVK